MLVLLPQYLNISPTSAYSGSDTVHHTATARVPLPLQAHVRYVRFFYTRTHARWSECHHHHPRSCSVCGTLSCWWINVEPLSRGRTPGTTLAHSNPNRHRRRPTRRPTAVSERVNAGLTARAECGDKEAAGAEKNGSSFSVRIPTWSC